MAAFSYDQHPDFVLESFLVPNSSNNISNFYEEGIINTCCSPMMPNNGYLQEIPLHVQIQETSIPLYKGCSDQEVPIPCTTDPCFSTVNKLYSNSSSVVIEQLDSDSVDQVTQAATSTQEKRKNIDVKAKERRIKRGPKGQKTVFEEAPSGYVHVRARRGEATHKHSLAERARREKIRERMKLLQSLVPGCDKMIGEILTLDHIIKYVQTLQTQVEFLAAQPASTNPKCISGFEVDFDTNTLAHAKTRSSDFQLPPVLESSSTQLTSFPEESTALIDPEFLLLDQEQRSNITFQVLDNSNLLWGSTDDSRRHRLANHFGSDNLSSFQW